MRETIALPGSTLRLRPTRLFSDDRLVRRAQQGDDRAFAAIYDRYHQDLVRYCQAILGNSQDAEDALQNTMVKAMRALPGETREVKLKPWLYRIAHNEAIEVIRRRHPAAEIDPETTPALEAGPHQSTETQERLRRLINDLGELPERQRSALVLRELSGMSFEDIGATFETTPAVVRQTIYEARSSLQQMNEGREMSCENVRKALSDGDGRTWRRRDIRAHLRECTGCADFREAIACRRRDLASLSPLPALTSAGILHGLLGGAHGSSGTGGLAATLGGGTTKVLGASALLKSAVAVVAVSAVGVAAADRGGLIHLGSGDPGGGASAQSLPAPSTGNPHSPASQLTSDGDESLPKTDRKRGAGTASHGKPNGEIHSAQSHSAATDKHSSEASSEVAAPSITPGGDGALPEAASHGQETATAHKPQLPAAAQSHPTPASHPGKSAASPGAESHPAQSHATPPGPPAGSAAEGHTAKPALAGGGKGH